MHRRPDYRVQVKSVNRKPASRRARRIAARREQILEAAAAVFSDKGYERATTRDIADAADVSEGTLYNYFASKQDLLLAVAGAFADEVIAGIASIRADDIAGMMTALMTQRFRGGRERRLFIFFLHEAQLNPDVQEFYVHAALFKIIDETEKRIGALVAEGAMRPVDVAIAARTLSAAVMGFATLFALGGEMWDWEKYPPEVLGAGVTDIFLNGLSQRVDSEETP